jgi:hypothetical protein
MICSLPLLIRTQSIKREIRNNQYPNRSRNAGYFGLSRKRIQRAFDLLYYGVHAEVFHQSGLRDMIMPEVVDMGEVYGNKR